MFHETLCLVQIWGNCDKFYIGEGDRTLPEKIKEHKTYIRNADGSKSDFAYKIESSLVINFSGASDILPAHGWFY